MALATASQEVCKKLYSGCAGGWLWTTGTRHAGVAVTSQRGGFSGFAHAADPGFSGFLWIFEFFRWILGSGRCPSGETSKFCFRWPSGEPEMIFKSPDQAPGQLRIFLDQRLFISWREHRPIFHIFEKIRFSKKLEYSASSERCATPWYIETSALRIYFYVRSVKLHFGEFSNLTFQAVSWSLLFSLGCLQARHSFIFPRNTTRPCFTFFK